MARAAGLPDGTFGLLEVNYSGFATPSGVFPGASSNDSELHLTAEEVGPVFIRGDCDGDAAALLTDAVFLLNHNFLGGPELPCMAACDANGDGRVAGQVLDAVYLVTHLFLGGPPPPEPFPACGPDLQPSGLACDTEPDCF